MNNLNIIHFQFVDQNNRLIKYFSVPFSKLAQLLRKIKNFGDAGFSLGRCYFAGLNGLDDIRLAVSHKWVDQVHVNWEEVGAACASWTGFGTESKKRHHNFMWEYLLANLANKVVK